MRWDLALAAIADHPHAWRFRQLCAEDDRDSARRDAYRALVIRLAGGDPPDRPAPVVHYRDPDAPRPCGGCPG